VYTPILRNRQSELLAIQQLRASVRRRCTPLLDVAAPTKDADLATARAYVIRNAQRVTKAIQGFSRAFVDSSELDAAFRVGGSHPLSVLADAVQAANCTPIPVTGLHRDRDHMRAAFRIKASTESEEICFRLDATDVGTASRSHAELMEILERHSADPSDVVLLLDLQSVYAMDSQALAAPITRFMGRAGQSRWAGIIVAGYGVPDQISNAVAVRQQGYIARIEQEVFNRVAGQMAEQNVWFGDYTTVPPTQVELDWWVFSRVMGPKAIYALEDSWFVVRGSPFSGHADGYGQYHDVANEIVALAEFSGAGYSWGDAYIHERATDPSSSSGSPSSWIKACVNHHITLTANAHAGA